MSTTPVLRILASLACFGWLLVRPATAASPTPITKYGSDTPAMQRTLDEHTAVHCPAGTYSVTAPLRLHSGQTFTLDPSCTLRWTGPAANSRLLDVTGASDVTIRGSGLLDGAQVAYMAGLELGQDTHRLLVEDLRIANFGSLNADWGTRGDGLYMSYSAGCSGCPDEGLAPSDLTFRRLTISNSARIGIAWLRGHRVTMESVTVKGVGGVMGPASNRPGEYNVPGACVDIEPSVPGAQGPPYWPIDGTVTNLRCEGIKGYALQAYGGDWTGPVTFVNPVFAGDGGNVWTDPAARGKVVLQCGKRGYRPCR